MDAHKALITNIFNNSTLVEVPFFQRSYVWKEDLWARLLVLSEIAKIYTH